MNLIDFLLDLSCRGISLSSEGRSLKVHAPKGAVTPALREQLLQHRDAVVAYLTESAADDGGALPTCVPDTEHLYEPFPMSDLQLGFYMADDPYMDFHVRPHYYVEKDKGELHADAYEIAWNKALQRHRNEIATVLPDGTLQNLVALPLLRIPVYDMRSSPAEEVQRHLSDVRANMMRSELPLDRWPWLDIRVTLWSVNGNAQSRVHCNFNNFFVDGFGTTRLLQEVERFYREPDLMLPPLSLSFRDAVVALEALALSPAGARAKKYWEDRLPQLPGPPDLPMKAGPDRRCRSRLNRRKQVISSEAWSSFKSYAQHHGLTPSNALFAAYAELIGTWSNSRHFVVNNMMTRRLNIHPEIRDILGNFASLYPLEIDLRTGATFVERARRMQERVIRDAQHLQWGGMQVLQSLNRLKGSFGRAPVPFVVGSGLFIDSFELDGFSCLETSQVMLDYQFFESGDGRLIYVWDLLEAFFPDGMIDDMWQVFASLIEGLARDGQSWCQESFDLTSARHLADRKAVCPPAQEVAHLRLDEFLAHSAASHPDAVALAAPGATLSYGDLADGADKLAGLLQHAGVSRGDTVAVITDRGPDLLRAVYGILQAGAAYVPIDPSLPDERRAYLLENCGARHVITTETYASALAWPSAIHVLTGALHGAAPVNVPRGDITDLAYVIYTSGSTGRPKGVMIDHRGAVNTVLSVNERFQVGPDDRIFGVSSFGFDLSVYDIFGAAAAGATLVYPEPQHALDPAHWLDQLARHRVTVWNSAPPLASLLIELAEYRDAALPDLRLVMLSGDWIPVDLPDRIRKIAPQAQVVSLGGATEASIWSIWFPIDQVDRNWASIPYGYPMPNQTWAILDERSMPVPEWTAGDLYIGGIGLALGYWQDPDKTAASFIQHPVMGERLYRTGDIGRYLPGGVIEFLGRKDTQVKIQGHRIELGEIEAVLADHPAVSSAVVVAQKPSSGGSAQLVAHVVCQSDAGKDVTALQEFLARKLPVYMVPRLFNYLDRLPLSSNGKVDRQALPRLEEQRTQLATERRMAPRDQIEAQLLTIWKQVLRRDDLAPTDDFFELGGQSFEAVRVVGLIREVLKASLSIGDIWEHRNIARLADHLREGDTHGKTRCLVDLAAGTGDPVFLVHPAGGHVLCYRELAQRLNRPVLAFQAPGVDGREAPCDSIATLAARYVEQLNAAQPQGPVVLGGWSSGGLIAYEMAVQLRAQGRHVGGVFVLDSPPPLVHDAIADDVLFDWFIGDLGLDDAVCNAIRPINAGTPDEQQKLEKTAACLQEHGIDLGADVTQFSAIYRVFKGIVQGGRRYRAAATDVDMLVVRASRGIVSEFARHPDADSPDWGWKRFSGGTLDTGQVDATHYTLLASPALDNIVTMLEQWLDRLETTETEAGVEYGRAVG